MKDTENICKVCGEHYGAKQRRCPKCGCPVGGNKPTYLRCKRCSTVFLSRRKTCPSCGQHVTPQTAAGVLLPPNEAARRRRTVIRWSIAVAVLLIVVIAEGFLVKNIYANIAYRQSLQLWNCGGSIEANRRAPDPIYEEPVIEKEPDTLLNVVTTTSQQVADTISYESDEMMPLEE